ncbi:MAG: hypothetical protein K0M48_10280, partial [Thiobacillus sp.]|nr:hypothetical protein [Thiobacillus sp.]
RLRPVPGDFHPHQHGRAMVDAGQVAAFDLRQIRLARSLFAAPDSSYTCMDQGLQRFHGYTMEAPTAAV